LFSEIVARQFIGHHKNFSVAGSSSGQGERDLPS
jgi:hypothetical protein